VEEAFAQYCGHHSRQLPSPSDPLVQGSAANCAGKQSLLMLTSVLLRLLQKGLSRLFILKLFNDLTIINNELYIINNFTLINYFQ